MVSANQEREVQASRSPMDNLIRAAESMLSRRKGRVACKVKECSATFSCKGSMKTHLNRAHLGMRFSCLIPRCPETRTTWCALMKHVNRDHHGRGELYKLRCPLCNKELTAKNLKRHQNSRRACRK